MSGITGDPGETKTALAIGLTADRYRIVDAETAGAVFTTGTITTGIVNTATQRYKAEISIPEIPDNYEIQWDDGTGAWDTTEDVISGGGPRSTTVTGPWVVGDTASIFDRQGQLPGHSESPVGRSVVDTATIGSDLSITLTRLALGDYWAIAQDREGIYRWVAFTVE